MCVPRGLLCVGPWARPDGEANTRVVGAVRSADRWRLHAWQALGDDEWLALDVGEQLHALTEPSSRTVLTGTTEVGVVVAGPVSDRARAADAAPEVWSLSDTPEQSGGRWERHPTATVPDAFTHVASWDLGWWVAGHRDGRPVVYEFDDPGGGAALAVPDTRLDPHHPLTVVAGIPVERPLVLATQSVDGPAVRVDDGALWVRALPAAAGQP